jgi:hypothetical protein
MGLAPSRNGENPRKSVVAKVPVPILSQPRSVEPVTDFAILRGGAGVPASACLRWRVQFSMWERAMPIGSWRMLCPSFIMDEIDNRMGVRP